MDFSPTHPARGAEGFGVKSATITSAAELDAGLDMAFSANEPVFLDVVSESEVSELPPVYSWLQAAGKLTKPISKR